MPSFRSTLAIRARNGAGSSPGLPLGKACAPSPASRAQKPAPAESARSRMHFGTRISALVRAWILPRSGIQTTDAANLVLTHPLRFALGMRAMNSNT